MTPRSALRLGFASLVALSLPLAVSGPAEASDKRELTVMTQNLYLGSSLTSAITATTPQSFVLAVAQIYGTAMFTSFETRSEEIARTIAAEQPDLVGLQEVSTWTATGFVPGAAPMSVDFLEVLMDDLEDLGLDYEVASVANNADIGPAPLIAPAFGCPGSPVVCSVRLQDRDVILVNDDTSGLTWSDPQSGRYDEQQTFQPPGATEPVSFSRGWTSIQGSFEGKKFRFVNTHFETEDFPEVQEEQAREFLAGPARGGGAVIATGDFNSAADGSTTDSYAALTKAWFDDAWSVNAGDAGLTCCQNSPLTNPVSQLSSRIDLVLTHGAVRPLTAEVVGDEPFRSVPPLWASDHAGVVATLRLH